MSKAKISHNSKDVHFFDTHCHLHDKEFDHDRDEVIQKMLRAKVDKFLTVGTSVQNTEDALRLRDKYPNICLVSAGIIPTETQQYVESPEQAEKDFKKLAEIASKNKVDAIGETGLDKYWKTDTSRQTLHTPETLEIQHLLFELHISLAKELKLPLIIHQREALTPTLKTLTETSFIGDKKRKAGIFHSFTGDIKDAKRIINSGFLLGINGIITFDTATKLQGAVRKLSPKDIVLETDSPLLTPEPYRGQRNNPSMLPIISDIVAGLMKCAIIPEVYMNYSSLTN